MKKLLLAFALVSTAVTGVEAMEGKEPLWKSEDFATNKGERSQHYWQPYYQIVNWKEGVSRPRDFPAVDIASSKNLSPEEKANLLFHCINKNPFGVSEKLILELNWFAFKENPHPLTVLIDHLRNKTFEAAKTRISQDKDTWTVKMIKLQDWTLTSEQFNNLIQFREELDQKVEVQKIEAQQEKIIPDPFASLVNQLDEWKKDPQFGNRLGEITYLSGDSLKGKAEYIATSSYSTLNFPAEARAYLFKLLIEKRQANTIAKPWILDLKLENSLEAALLKLWEDKK